MLKSSNIFFEKVYIKKRGMESKNYLYIDNTVFDVSHYLKKKRETFHMKDFTTYLSTAPVLTLVSLTAVAGLLIEINRFFPDALTAAF